MRAKEENIFFCNGGKKENNSNNNNVWFSITLIWCGWAMTVAADNKFLGFLQQKTSSQVALFITQLCDPFLGNENNMKRKKLPSSCARDNFFQLVLSTKRILIVIQSVLLKKNACCNYIIYMYVQLDLSSDLFVYQVNAILVITSINALEEQRIGQQGRPLIYLFVRL